MNYLILLLSVNEEFLLHTDKRLFRALNNMIDINDI